MKPTFISAGEIASGDPRYTYDLSQADPSIGILCEYNIKIPARDGVMLECDIYRPDKEGQYPVILSLAPYLRQNNRMSMHGVDAEDRGGVGTTLELFEQPNPEFWIPRGYVFITVNPRGFGGSEGKHEAMQQSQHEDFYDAIEWAAAQPWSTGKVGIAGISYYAMSQYGVAALQPPHLSAMVPWEGLADPYRDIAYRGGMRSGFGTMFMLMLDTLKNSPLWRNSYLYMVFRHSLMGDTWFNRGSGIDLSKIEVPMLSVGNLSDVDLHLRGNVEAFMAAKSPHKKLRLYAGTHWGSAYQPWARREELRFFDHWLKGIDTGIEREPAVNVDLRTGSASFEHVYGDTWPLQQTKWLRLHMDTRTSSLSYNEVAETHSVQSQPGIRGGKSHRVTFQTQPLAENLAIAGPITCRVWVSSSTKDADISIEVNDIDETGNATLFPYYFHHGDDEPVSRGWLRASHRALDTVRTLPYRPFHKHDKNEWLTPGQPVPLDIEIWPTSMVFKAGHRIEVIVHTGKHKRRGELGNLVGKDADKKRSNVYDFASKGSGRITIHSGGEYASWIDLPVIPAEAKRIHEIVIQDGTFVPQITEGQIGDRFDFVNRSEDYHSTTEQSPLRIWDSQLIRGTRSHNPETWGITIPWAGTYHYRDEVNGNIGTITVSSQITSSDKDVLHIKIAAAPPPENFGFEVEVRYGSGLWRAVEKGLLGPEFDLKALESGEVTVRARLLRRSDSESTSWSPEARWSF